MLFSLCGNIPKILVKFDTVESVSLKVYRRTLTRYMYIGKYIAFVTETIQRKQREEFDQPVRNGASRSDQARQVSSYYLRAATTRSDNSRQLQNTGQSIWRTDTEKKKKKKKTLSSGKHVARRISQSSPGDTILSNNLAPVEGNFPAVGSQPGGTGTSSR